MRRALFFPSDLGGGFGHIGRCLALAEELVNRGWQVALALRGPHAGRVAAAGWTVYTPPLTWARTQYRRLLQAVSGWIRPAPSYAFLSDLSFQVLRDGLSTLDRVEKILAWELSIVNRFRPDVLIGDTWLLTSLLGHATSLPVVQIIQTVFHPAGPNLVWWRSLPSEIHAPEIEPAFRPVLERLGRPSIKCAEELLDGDLLLVPGIPELDPLPPNAEHTHHVGILTRPMTEGNEQVSEWLASLPSDRPVIYVTVGGGANLGQRDELLALWQAACADEDWTVVVSTGGRRVPPKWRRQDKLIVMPWVPSAAIMSRADMVVFHGGHGTMMETVRYGVPSVAIAFHSEQEANGRRLEANGVGLVLPYSEGPYEPLQFEWPNGTATMLVGRNPTVTGQQLRHAVSRVLREGSFRHNALRLQQSLTGYAGPPQAADLVASIISE